MIQNDFVPLVSIFEGTKFIRKSSSTMDDAPVQPDEKYLTNSERHNIHIFTCNLMAKNAALTQCSLTCIKPILKFFFIYDKYEPCYFTYEKEL